MSISPKGKYRMWRVAVIAVVALLFVWLFNGDAWLNKQFNNISEIAIGGIALYGLCRAVLHKRTHELNDTLQRERENYLIIAIAIVVGCALL